MTHRIKSGSPHGNTPGKEEAMDPTQYPYTGSISSVGPGSKDSKADRQQGSEPNVMGGASGNDRP